MLPHAGYVLRPDHDDGGSSMINQADLEQIAYLHRRWLRDFSDGRRADFSGMNLENLDFDGMIFEAASFRGARIRDSFLCGNFVCADFRRAELHNVYADYSDYDSADFTDAVCRMCDFTRTKFDGARLRRADFGDANLTGAVLECCDMTGAKLDEALFSYTATMGSWGRTPPARDTETLAAEADFTAKMQELGLGDETKIAEWMDEAWSLAQDQSCGCEPKPGPREPEYRALLECYAAEFTQARGEFPDAAEVLFGHGEDFAPAELYTAAACLAEGNSLETVLDMRYPEPEFELGMTMAMQ